MTDKPEVKTYSQKRIGWELERTAMGDGYYGNALYVALDMSQLDGSEKDVLHRYLHGAELRTDRIRLQEIAIKVYNLEAAT